MQLTEVKLSGFKSFVDPTTFFLKSNLVGVVGPNGCGKSNIIDAVRWVMGEISPKNLRGSDATSVIFNGSDTRKPVSRAAVELKFDNSDAKISGEFAKFNEISVRREVSSDGQSNYYLNGIRCRRKDVTDLFLGTGIGPRSYAIIEQGMISKIIESKPEQMRDFFEEAAGIAIYKKRRHETGLRMKHTQENLDVLEVQSLEQTKLVERLQRQAQAAEKFQQLDSSLNKFTQELNVMRWKDLENGSKEIKAQINELAVKLEQQLTIKTTTHAEYEKTRLQHTEKLDAVNKLQSQYYELGANIARLEQNIKHQQEKHATQQQDLQDAQASQAEIQQQLLEDQARLEASEQMLNDILPKYASLEAEVDYSATEAANADNDLQEWQSDWQQLNSEYLNAQQSAEIQKAKIEQLDIQSREVAIRADRLQQELTDLEAVKDLQKLELLEAELVTAENIHNDFNEEINSINLNIEQEKATLQSLEAARNSINTELQKNIGRKTSLDTLQESALAKNEPSSNWVEEFKLENAKKLAEEIQVTSGYEKAVEMVLNPFLEAVEVESIEQCLKSLLDSGLAIDNVTNIKLIAKINPNNTAASFNSPDMINNSCKKLQDVVSSNLNLNNLLEGIYVVDDLNTAIEICKDLQANQSVVTKSGIWLSNNWFRVLNDADPKQGIIAREQEINKLKILIEENQHQLDNSNQQIYQLQENIEDLESQKNAISNQQKDHNYKLRDLSSKVTELKTQLDNISSRKQRINEELLELNNKQQKIINDLQQSRIILENAIELMAELDEKLKLQTSAKEELVNNQQERLAQLNNYKTSLHEIALDKQTYTTQVTALQESVARLEKQYQYLVTKINNLQDAMLLVTTNTDNELQIELEQYLSQRHAKEGELNTARDELNALEILLQQQEQATDMAVKISDELRESINDLKIKYQSLQVRQETLSEALGEPENISALLAQLSEDANESAWNVEIDNLKRQISSLGAINLAAIDEYAVELERNNYLQTQLDDLREALETLTLAIAKIDQETRDKFKETFEFVNHQFKVLFPKLFGGGQAYLELTSDDLLETGVSVMARPPGKRNSSIHLLSGGEKALTAVALVFAIFQLNPAPFCMLDEVDAPLDDANVGRFVSMVKEMSDTVQFIFITHNKITMEAANQLCGVTMKEPGVSRLVAVDIQKALEMAE